MKIYKTKHYTYGRISWPTYGKNGAGRTYITSGGMPFKILDGFKTQKAAKASIAGLYDQGYDVGVIKGSELLGKGRMLCWWPGQEGPEPENLELLKAKLDCPNAKVGDRIRFDGAIQTTYMVMSMSRDRLNLLSEGASKSLYPDGDSSIRRSIVAAYLETDLAKWVR